MKQQIRNLCSTAARQAGSRIVARPSTSTSASSPPATPTFTRNRRYFDSLDKRHSPHAKHYVLKDRPTIAFTIRPAPSPLPASMPVVALDPSSTAAAAEAGQKKPSSHGAATTLPPLLRASKAFKQQQTYNNSNNNRMTSEQIAEMQALRLSDPSKWTRSELARKFNVSPYFVGIVGFGDTPAAKQASKDAKEIHEAEKERRFEAYGLNKRVASEVRRLRKQFW